MIETRVHNRFDWVYNPADSTLPFPDMPPGMWVLGPYVSPANQIKYEVWLTCPECGKLGRSEGAVSADNLLTSMICAVRGDWGESGCGFQWLPVLKDFKMADAEQLYG